MNGPPVVLRGYVPIHSGEHPDCNCTPDPVTSTYSGVGDFSGVRGWLHEPACPVTDNALQYVAEAGVA